MAEPLASPPDAVQLIRAKRDGLPLTAAQIGWLMEAYLGGEVADEQMSALLMAVYFQGLDTEELRAWTSAMIDSGERLELAGAGGRPWTSIPPAGWATRCR